jgi:hypothetical protein
MTLLKNKILQCFNFHFVEHEHSHLYITYLDVPNRQILVEKEVDCK